MTEPTPPMRDKHHTHADLDAARAEEAHGRTEAPATTGTTQNGVEADGAERVEEPEKKQPPLLVFVLALPVVLGLMLLAFATPAVHSGAKDLPLAVSGPQQVTSKITSTLEKEKPGAFDVKTYSAPEQGADAVKNRDAIGGIAVTPQGAAIQTAAGAGSPYSALLKGVGAGLEKQGQKVTYQELAPLPAKDPMGTAMTSAGLPLIFGGMATSAALFFTFRGSFGRRALGVVGVATLGGLLAAWMLTSWLDAVDCSFWKLALAFGLGIAAIGFTVLGLAKNLGPAGFGLGAVAMLFISNPISGLATGPQWLPHPWGTIGQFLPVGAAGTALRSVAYFDGRGASQAWIVLLCWAFGGFVLLSLGKWRKTAH
ncbi:MULTISPECIES: ABC transporter permease [Dermacoccus]|nr:MULTISPECIES: ABC transporter permease [Dermacoccus]MBO1758213.1 ABC transporter permease [Dermacoccus sp. NHGro5]